VSFALPPVLLAVASIALVFVASMSARIPLRRSHHLADARAETAMRVLHRGLVLHIVLSAAAVCAVVIGTEAGWKAIAIFLAVVALARYLGDRFGRDDPRTARMLALLLAPVDGLALLIGWGSSAGIRRQDRVGTPAAPGGAGTPAEDAYEQVLELTQKTVERVMVPRSEIAWLPSQATIPEILETVRRRQHSRYPVFEGDFEQLVGMLDLVDLALPRPAGMRAADLARPAVVVPETVACDDLIFQMCREHFETAIVIDEFGGMAGLVTLEDLLELIVGELVGEHEAIQVRVRKLDDGSYHVDGTTRIEELEHILGIAFPEGEYETIAGLYLQRSARIPDPGEWVDIDGIRIEVVAADDRRIRTLRVTLPGIAANGKRRAQTLAESGDRDVH